MPIERLVLMFRLIKHFDILSGGYQCVDEWKKFDTMRGWYWWLDFLDFLGVVPSIVAHMSDFCVWSMERRYTFHGFLEWFSNWNNDVFCIIARRCLWSGEFGHQGGVQVLHKGFQHGMLYQLLPQYVWHLQNLEGYAISICWAPLS